MFLPDGEDPDTLVRKEGKEAFVSRLQQAQSLSNYLFEHLLAENGLGLDQLKITDTCRTENDTIAAVASGSADAAPGLQALALQFGLDFVPTRKEQFDLLVCRKAWFDAPFQTLMKFTQTSLFKEKARQFEGYNTTALGTVVWNA